MCVPEPTVSRSQRHQRRQRGLSLIELMVGIVVALLIGLAASGSASVFTAAQRQGVGTGGVAVNAASALSALKNDAAGAGLGFFGDSRLLCDQLNLSVGASVLVNGADFSPVRITTVDDDSRIDVLAATMVAGGTNVRLATASDGTSAELASLLPAVVGQAVLLAPEDPGLPCVVRSITAVAASTATTPQTLTFGNAGRHNAAAFSTSPAYAERSRITLLGELRWSRYRLDGTNLLLERPLDNTSAVLVRNVIGFRAEYGIAAAAAGSTTLEAWQDASGDDFAAVDSDALPRVRALRIGLVTRSPQREKPDASGACRASTAKPELFGEEIEPDVTDWACFRYRTSVVVVPLRNLVLGMAP